MPTRMDREREKIKAELADQKWVRFEILKLPPKVWEASADAHLPANYEHAKAALANCSELDECKTWANKDDAAATYARMARDDSLRQMADRIKGRAVRRCSELLKQFDGRGGDRSKSAGAHTFARQDAAREAGMSKHQQVTAVRVANVSEKDFECVVESENPPTVTQLAEMGKTCRPPLEVFKQTAELLAIANRFVRFCGENDPDTVADAICPHDANMLRADLSVARSWIDRFLQSTEA